MKIEEIKELNAKIIKCKKCRLWKSRTNVVIGEGNLDARIMMVAQAPGENEDREAKMFIGPSGKVLNELLKYAGVKREQIYMTNLIKCFLPKYRKPKKDEIEACSKYLDREIEIINPEIIVPLGYYATKYIFKKYGIEMPDMPYGKLFLAEKKIYPLHHPASLLYNDNIKEEMMKHYSKLKIFMHECKWFPVCPMHYFYDKGMLDKKWIELYCKGDWESCIRYQMEENGVAHPDNMLPDGSIDENLTA